VTGPLLIRLIEKLQSKKAEEEETKTEAERVKGAEI